MTFIVCTNSTLPTGALDYNTSKEILKLIENVNVKYGNTVIMVTHNEADTWQTMSSNSVTGQCVITISMNIKFQRQIWSGRELYWRTNL